MPPTRTSKQKRKPDIGICPHCSKELTLKTIRIHMAGIQHPPITLPQRLKHTTFHTTDIEDGGYVSSDENDDEVSINLDLSSSDIEIDNEADAAHTIPADNIAMHPISRTSSPLPNVPLPCSSPDIPDIEPPPISHQPAIGPTQPRVLRSRHTVTIEEVPESDNEEDRAHDHALDDEHGINWTQDMADEDYLDPGLAGLSLEDVVNENMEQELAEYAQELSDNEIALMRQFAFKIEHHITLEAFAALPFAFPDTEVHSWKVTASRARWLAEFMPKSYDCCMNSCCLFVGSRANDEHCFECKEPRYRSDGSKRPRKRFTYIPLIPRLVAFFRSLSMIDKLKYRAAFEKSAGSGVRDIFDGKLYDHLQATNVSVADVELPFKHFEFDRDIALGLSTDGFAPWRRRKKTCWPLLIFLYNLPPEIRFNLENVLCIGVIPGPKKPKDFDSFLWPLIEELMELARGTRAFDISEKDIFALHAYLIVVFGDIPAMSMASRTVGHNGFRPCRWCNICGIRSPDGRTYYVPLDRSVIPSARADPEAVKKYDPLHLPMRTHTEMRDQAEDVQFARTATDAKELSTKYGIKGTSIFHNLSSIVFPYSFPYDFMHLMFENNIKNLIGLWTGTYKDLDEGDGHYQFATGVWEKIGELTTACGRHIPSAFGAKPPNIADDKTAMTADAYSFWFQYIAPVVLDGRLSQPYYNHFITLVKLIRLCLEFELNGEKVEQIQVGFKNWVEEYERLYYQNEPERVRACPLTLHALLHIYDGIKWIGPVWTYWSFPMERYCGRLQPAIKSRRHPFASIDNYIASYAQLSHIKNLYSLHYELEMRSARRNVLRLPRGHFSHPKYPSHILLPPSRPSSTISSFWHEKIKACLATRWDTSVSEIRKYYQPDRVTQWGKVRQLAGGDDMKAFALDDSAEDKRDATWVRYDLYVDRNARYRSRPSEFDLKPFYGQLEHIFVVAFPTNPSFDVDTETVILAGIHQCAGIKEGNGMKMPYYSRMGGKEVVDMDTLTCLVGRIPLASNQIAILDRTGNLRRELYVSDE